MNREAEVEHAIADIRDRIGRSLRNMHGIVICGTLILLGFFSTILIAPALFHQRFPSFVQSAVFGVVSGLFYFSFRFFTKRRLLDLYADDLPFLIRSPVTIPEFLARAEVFANWEHFEAAVSDYRRALAIDSDHGETLLRFASLLFMLERKHEALEHVRRLESLGGAWLACALLLKGKIVQEDDPALATKCFREAIAIEPRRLEGYFLLVRGLLNQNQLEEAERTLEEIRKRLSDENLEHFSWDVENPDTYTFFYLSGLLCHRRRNDREALEMLDFIGTWGEYHDKDYHFLKAEVYEALDNSESSE